MVRQAHEDSGVTFHFAAAVERFEGEEAVKTVVLKNGIRIDADLVLIGIGVTPNTGCLRDVPKEADGSIRTDACFRAAEDVYAAGDIARLPDWRSGEHIRIEHWRTAEQQGRDAALNMAGKPTVNGSVPFFWTKQANMSIRYVGHAQAWDEIIFDGDVASRSFIAFYIRNNEVHAAAGCKRELGAGVTRACAERRGSHVRPRRSSRIHSPEHAYRCRSRDAPRNQVRQVGWQDAARQSRRRADTVE